MRKLRIAVALILAAATLLALASRGVFGDGGGTGEGNGDLPKWPDPATPEKMKYPEPNGAVAYTKIEVTENMVTSSTPWNDGADVAANAFDGNTGTFFDGIENGWIKVDLGERVVIGQLGFAPRSGYEGRLNGSFYGSVDGIEWTLIYAIPTAPSSRTLVKHTKFQNVAAFRYIKYENTKDCANISEFEIYSAVNIDPKDIMEPAQALYADNTPILRDKDPKDEGMTAIKLTINDEAATDNNPSTLVKDASKLSMQFAKESIVGAIEFISDSSSVGGKFYGVKSDGTRDLLWEIKDAPTARRVETVMYGEIMTTGKYASVEFEKAGGCNLAEVSVYGMSTDTSVPITALPFAMSKEGKVDCVALNWGSPTLKATSYEIYRQRENGPFKLVYEGSGTSWQDYSLPLGNYTYEVRMKYGDTVISGERAAALCREMPEADLFSINNQTGQNLSTKSDIFDGEYYYTYSLTGGASTLTEKRSPDGIDYTGRGNTRIVLRSSAHPLMKSCKIESVKVAYIKEKNKVIVAAHWEKPSGYADGKLFLATGTPGGEFTVDIFNPLGVEVRDMSIFVDDDNTAYLLAAANKPGVDSGANATTYVFKFNEDYTGIEEVTARLFPEMYREMPNIVKIDGLYYLFVSQTSGWCPSAGAYAVSNNMKTGWSDLRPIGNNSTFGSQSSWILGIGSGENKKYIMHAYRWGQVQGTIPSFTMLAPITFSNGSAYYDFFPEILINAETGDMIPISNGQLLSQNASVTATIPASADGAPSKLVDGDYNTAYIASSNTWPLSVQLDLGHECDVSNVQISWNIVKGSEAFYLYKVLGSNDGKNWDILRDSSKLSDKAVTKTIGFSYHPVEGTYRYIKVEATAPYRWVDGGIGERLDWYTPTIYEVKVFGTDPGFKNTAADDPTETEPADTDPAEDEKGCSSVIGMPAVITVVSVLGCAAVRRKRRD